MELWNRVKGWEDKYLISNTGKLKSLNGKFSKQHPNGYITVGCIGQSGYREVTLRKPGVLEKFRIHTLVGNEFVEKPISIKRLCINHVDGNKLNNNDWNLEWITLGDNVRHAVKLGLMDFKGEKHPGVKMTEEMVIDIRRMRMAGITHEQISRSFGISRRQIGDIINGVNWGWLRYGL